MSIFTKTPEQVAAKTAKRQVRSDKIMARLRRGQFREVRLGTGLLLNALVTKDGKVVESGHPSNCGPFAGSTLTIATEGEIKSRYTVTRIALLGIFALAFKKKTSDKDVYAVFSGEGFDFITGPLKRTNEMEARRLAQKYNRLSKDIAENGLPD